MRRILEVNANLEDGAVNPSIPFEQIKMEVMDKGKIVILKNVFPEILLAELRRCVVDWGKAIELVSVDDFRANYHRQRAMVSRLQQAPHVFHDYNFNKISQTSDPLGPNLLGLFEPLLSLYCELTGYELDFSIPEAGPYLHPQIIQYPVGGGFFGRHSHNLIPRSSDSSSPYQIMRVILTVVEPFST